MTTHAKKYFDTDIESERVAKIGKRFKIERVCGGLKMKQIKKAKKGKLNILFKKREHVSGKRGNENEGMSKYME